MVALQTVQQRVISKVPVQELNSLNHDFTLIQVASRKAICLSPGIYQDHSDQFTWIPFDCEENFPFYLCHHEGEKWDLVADFIKVLQGLYENTELPL